MNKKIILTIIVLCLFAGQAFAYNVCSNLEVKPQIQKNWFGQSYGNNVCISFESKTNQFFSQDKLTGNVALHYCKPKYSNNLVTLIYCVKLGSKINGN
jgi:hypothetical protein